MLPFTYSRGDNTVAGDVRASTDMVAHYHSPTDVLRDPRLSEVDKRGVLQRWALNAYRSELAIPKTVAAAYPSRLNDLIDALLDLEEPEIQKLTQRNAAPRSRRSMTRQVQA
jgi:hypothetical protein